MGITPGIPRGGVTIEQLNSSLAPYLTAAIAASTYLTQANAASTYVPRTGGTITGNLVVQDLVVGGVDGPRLNRSGATIRARSNDGLSDAPFSAGTITASGIVRTSNSVDFVGPTVGQNSWYRIRSEDNATTGRLFIESLNNTGNITLDRTGNVVVSGTIRAPFFRDANQQANFFGTGLNARNTWVLAWTNDGTDFGTRVTGISQESAGVVQINNGTTGTLRDLSLRNLTASGNINLTSGAVITSGAVGVGTLTINNDGNNRWQFIDGEFTAAGIVRPTTTNTRNLGTVSHRWANVFGVNGDFSGNVGVGISPTARLHVRGTGATSSTSSLVVEDSSGANWLSARDDRMFNVTGAISLNNGGNISPSAGSDTVATGQLCGLRFRSVLNLSDPLSEFFFRNSNGSRSFTSSFGALMEFSGGFAPASGTGTYAIARLTGIINQTGGANGITQGVLVAPTLTAAADWRSFDTNVNSGFAYHSSGTAPSRFGGNVGIGTVPTARFQVEANDNSTQGIFVRNSNDGTAASSDLTLSNLGGQVVSLRNHSSTHSVWANTSVLSSSQSGGLAINTSTTGPIVLFVSNSERARATTTGFQVTGNLAVGSSSLYRSTISGAAANTVYYGINTNSLAAGDTMFFGSASNAITGGVNGFQLTANCTGNLQNMLQNTNNSSSTANARFSVLSTGANGGDPVFEWTVSGQTNWAAGIDNSDSDSWVLGANPSLGVNTALRIDTLLNARFFGSLTAVGNIGFATARVEQPLAQSMALRTFESSLSAWQEPWIGRATPTGPVIGFLGSSPIGRQTLPAAATDPATTQALCNALRQLLINFGFAN